jgi:hypothetical protein
MERSRRQIQRAVEKLFAICRASSGLQIGIGDLQPGDSGKFRPAAASAKSAPLRADDQRSIRILTINQEFR